VAGSAALAALATAGALLSVTAAEAPSALAAVTAAASKTDATSYRVSMAVRYLQVGIVERVTGTFDPVRHVGQVTVTDSSRGPYKIRYLRGASYIFDPLNSNGHGKWLKVRILDAASPGNPALGKLEAGFDGILPEDPRSLLALLRTATEVRDAGPASGPGWTGTKYTFTGSAAGIQLQVTGTVAVDEQGRVRDLDVTRDSGSVKITDAISFSDFGLSVHVFAPPANQIANMVPVSVQPVS